ncbi:hypothetical protein GGR58DRAFT_491644 [Xylaria digitata]|nr:hypothetical protein GGR58DRAFT_491644 [Xylaria digitata]
MENKGRSQCDYYFPSGKSVSWFNSEYGAQGGFYPTLWNSSATSLVRGPDSVGDPGSPADLVSFDAIQLSRVLYSGPTELRPDAYVAWSCLMSLCAKTYDTVDITNGVTNIPNPRIQPLMDSGVISSITDYRDYVLLFRHLRDYSNNSESEYLINVADHSNIAAYLAEIFSTGWGEQGLGVSNSIPYATSPNLGWEFANSENLSATVANIADSMTEAIRASLNSTSETVTALKTRVYIRVSFGWLALPVAVTVLGLGFVAWVVVEAGKCDMPILKNSSLALLAYQVDGWAAESVLSLVAKLWTKKQRLCRSHYQFVRVNGT